MVGSFVDQVDLQTSDCGHLVLREGITERNGREIAKKFEKGRVYRIVLGDASLKLRPLLALLGTVPEIRGYQPTS